MPKLTHWDSKLANEVIAAHTSLDGAALPILHALQDEFGYVHEEAVPLVAQALNLSRAEVHGIVTFYHDFRREPAGRHVLKLCRAEACQSMNGPKMAEELLQKLGIGWGETTPDQSLTVEGVYCLGLCACAPSALYDGEPIGRLNRETLDAVVQEARGQ
jgi:formate dehydrogenase subunit gamma